MNFFFFEIYNIWHHIIAKTERSKIVLYVYIDEILFYFNKNFNFLFCLRKLFFFNRKNLFKFLFLLLFSDKNNVFFDE